MLLAQALIQMKLSRNHDSSGGYIRATVEIHGSMDLGLGVEVPSC